MTMKPHTPLRALLPRLRLRLRDKQAPQSLAIREVMVDRFAKLPGGCDSAWKKDPCGGVIGVQKGPLW